MLVVNIIAAAKNALSEWRRKQQAYAELSALDDRSLADIGITRAEIPYILSQPRASKVPSWTKAGRHSHAH